MTATPLSASPHRARTTQAVGAWLGLLRVWALLALAVTTTLACAADRAPQRPDRASQRETYRAALNDLDAARLDAFEAKREQLDDYPLRPYLEYYRLLRYISSVPPEAIARFRERNADTRLADRVLRHWLEALARNERWARYRAHYESGIGGTQHECRYYQALLETGARQAAFANAARLWRVGHSQPEACDPLFNAWISAGRVTDALAWQRLGLALDADQVSLARYVIEFLDAETRALGKRYVDVHRRPRTLRDHARFATDSPRMREIIVHGIERLARADPALARQQWDHYREQLGFSAATADGVRSALLLARVRREPGRIPSRLAAHWPPAGIDGGTRQAIATELALRALRRARWDAALEWIARLPNSARGAPRWLYWRARALAAAATTPPVAITPVAALRDPNPTRVPRREQRPRRPSLALQLAARAADDPIFGLVWTASGNRKPQPAPRPAGRARVLGDWAQAEAAKQAAVKAPASWPRASRTEADALYAYLSRQRNYYGFLAATRSGRPYALASAKAEIEPAELQRVASLPGIQRARELRALGELPEARLEWRWTTDRLTDEEVLTLAAVARRQDWPRMAIDATVQAGHWDYLDLRFPLPFRNAVLGHARQRGLAPSWVYAIARRESAFMTDARSGTGALGIMQLMPATARQTADRHGIALGSTWQLLDYDKNIELGTSYLAQMYARYDRNRVLASAAYNAGPARVDAWLQANPAHPADLWIESIPFRETRRYVRGVLAYAVIYARRLGIEDQPLLHPRER